MPVIRASQHRVMPWKNGQGSTTEIAVHPAGAGLEDFDWRVSMATVSADGPFSRFEGIDRTLTVLQGAGIRLSVGDWPVVELTPQSPPFAFPGDQPATASLLGSAIVDLNVMSRRERLTHAVRRFAFDGAASLETRGATVLFFGLTGQIGLETAEGPISLAPRDALLTGQTQPARWSITASGPSVLFCIEFFDAEPA